MRSSLPIHNSPAQSQALQRTQQQESSRAPSGTAAQTRASSTPPLTLNQFQAAPARSSDLDKANIKRIQKDLQAEIKTLGKMNPEREPLAYARRNMQLEGMVLKVLPGATYTEVQQHLNKLGHAPHPMISGERERDALIDDLKKQVKKNDKDGFKKVWTAHCERVADTLGAYHSLYGEVRSTNFEDEAERAQVDASHQAYRAHAATMLTTLTSDMPKSVDNFFKTRIDHAEEKKNGAKGKDRDALRTQLNQWKDARKEFSAFRDSEVVKGGKTQKVMADLVKTNETMDTALKNVAREDLINALKADAGNPLSALRVFLGAGIPQGVASYLHFGYVRSAVDAAMSDASFGAHVAATSAALGTGHKVVSDGIRPFVQVITDKTVGLGTAKVSALDVYPKALRVVTEQGSLKPRNEQRMATVNEQQKAKRDDFVLAQNANNFGTISGDWTGFSTFGAAHAIRDLIDQFTQVNAGAIHARAIASGVGGTFMAGVQSTAKYLQTHGDENIPTHRLTRTTKDWGELTQAAAAGAKKNLNPMEKDSLNDLLNRILGVAGGVGMSTALGGASEKGIEDVEPLDRETRDKLIHTLATYISSGATLQPFFSNNQAPAEANAVAKSEGKTTVGAKDRWKAPLSNITDPDRASLPHTQPPGSMRRVGEDLIHMTRGISQIAPQLTIAGINAGGEAIASGVSSGIDATKRKWNERGQRSPADQEGTRLDDLEAGGMRRRSNANEGDGEPS